MSQWRTITTNAIDHRRTRPPNHESNPKDTLDKWTLEDKVNYLITLKNASNQDMGHSSEGIASALCADANGLNPTHLSHPVPGNPRAKTWSWVGGGVGGEGCGGLSKRCDPPKMYCLSYGSTTMNRHHDQGNSYKDNI